LEHKANSDEISHRNEQQGIENWSKGHSYYKVATNLAEFHPGPRALLKVDYKNYEIVSAEEISNQNNEGASWLLVTAYFSCIW
jgi:hypothetical protein